MSSHGSSVVLLCLMTLMLMVVVILVHTYIPASTEVQTLMATTFSGFAGALLLALRGSNDRQPPAV